MKKNLILSFILLFISKIGLSEDTLVAKFPKYYIGIQGGPNLTMMLVDFKTVEWLDMGLGGQVGFSFQCNFNKIISLHTDFSYEMRVIVGVGDDLGVMVSWGGILQS